MQSNTLVALATDAPIDIASLIGSPILLERMTAGSRTDLRPWYGHVTAAELSGSNQGNGANIGARQYGALR